jgi:hypothetical protein
MNASAQGPIDADLPRRLIEYARVCRASPAGDVRAAVHSEFWERLFDDARLRSLFQGILSETEVRAMEPLLLARLPLDQYAALQADFYRIRAETETGTFLAKLRQIKNEILETCPADHKTSVRDAWTNVLGLLEVGEDFLGIDIFIDNLDEVPISPSQRLRLQDLLAQVRGAGPTQANDRRER